MSFTNAIIRNLSAVELPNCGPQSSRGQLEGEIVSLQYVPSGSPTERNLPAGAVLNTSYNILVTVLMTLKRYSDKTVLWQSDFGGERSYVAPNITAAGINTLNPLYNLSARRQNLDIIASEIMAEAHSRLTENF